MSIKIQCPQCREKYSAGEEYIGRRFKCRCGALIEVPDLSAFLRKTDRATAPVEKSPPPQATSPKNADAFPPQEKQSGEPEKNPSSTSGKPEYCGITAYGILAILFGTTGTLAVIAAGTFAASAFWQPLFGNAESDCRASGIALGIFVVAFLLAAVFRLADLVIRRSGTRYFF